MDWVSAFLSAVSGGIHNGTAVRRGIRLCTALCRLVPGGVWHVHDESLHAVLAGDAGSGNLYWTGQWMSLRAQRG
ncbi:hypothetical protein CSC84_14745, partial [Staphylococcus aureus]